MTTTPETVSQALREEYRQLVLLANFPVTIPYLFSLTDNELHSHIDALGKTIDEENALAMGRALVGKDEPYDTSEYDRLNAEYRGEDLDSLMADIA